jgi:parallel beta-helix repeat protein
VKPWAAVLSLVLAVGRLPAVEFFVSPTGDNHRDGLSPAAAFADLERADQAVGPGDLVTVLDGRYEHVWSWVLKHSGSPESPITYRAANRGKAYVLSTGRPPKTDYCDAIRVNANYIVIDGFELSSASSGNGAWVEDAHHVTVRHCLAHDCGGAGIAAQRADYLTFEDNVVHHCSFTNGYQTSGISICAPLASDDRPGLRMIVRRNVCYANENKVGPGGGPVAKATDGNGIIIDWFSNRGCKYPANGCYPGKAGQPTPPYEYGALVEGNLCYDNGARGVCVTFSDNVTIRCNTLYHNCRNHLEGTMFGDLGVYTGDNCRIVDNIVAAGNFARQALVAGTVHPGARTRITASHNLLSGGPVLLVGDCGTVSATIDADPRFVAPGIDPATADFHLRPGSPAIGAADGGGQLGAYGLPPDSGQ